MPDLNTIRFLYWHRFMRPAYDAMVEHKMEWSNIYEWVFSEFGPTVVYHEFDIDIDYYDPDASYQEDVEAWINALQQRVDELTPALAAHEAWIEGLQTTLRELEQSAQEHGVSLVT